jgi:hypothetical protein
MLKQINQEKKKRLITLIFFGTTNNDQDDVNPYDSVTQFMAHSVGTLNWGTGANIRIGSKHRFAYTFHSVLKIFNVSVHPNTVIEIISDDATMLKDAIDRIVENAFPTL